MDDDANEWLTDRGIFAMSRCRDERSAREEECDDDDVIECASHGCARGEH